MTHRITVGLDGRPESTAAARWAEGILRKTSEAVRLDHPSPGITTRRVGGLPAPAPEDSATPATSPVAVAHD
ncbi:hypothetical protein [Streptomyces sp. NBC_01296]|uniref:hypothetical protein n=1 Tax=Streptomyces sp. NBC_01296 TaxID=2903816 RepID=UPI002E0E7436|nr:hypothetical protein OG299_38255 [Streptomyces sp. NBC_01296]WSW57377.1 hypothetical protein OG513_01650 [Streptomyces sp. NBC_00998]